MKQPGESNCALGRWRVMQEVLNDGGDVGSSLQGYKLGLALFSLQLVAFPVFDCVPQNLLVGLGSAGEVGQPVKIHTNQQ